jgi:hypothetical protein
LLAQAVAQAQELPNSLSGRWRFAMDGTTQTFSLEEIKAQPDKTFTAKLTWWQSDPWCATRSLPIVGQQTESGIAFEVPKKCNISYSVQLHREASGWIGTASNSMRGFGPSSTSRPTTRPANHEGAVPFRRLPSAV